MLGNTEREVANDGSARMPALISVGELTSVLTPNLDKATVWLHDKMMELVGGDFLDGR